LNCLKKYGRDIISRPNVSHMPRINR